MKALALFSGGLDSILSVCLIKQQGIEVEAVCFTSLFFDAKKAEKASSDLNIPLLKVDITEKLLPIIKSPPHGFGKGVNPCIDCHILMFKTAKKLMEKRKAKFLISGEVLGERPKSQNRKALKIIDKETELEGYILRPLTAKNLPPTVPEIQGWVEREKLLGIKGRSRKVQFELAKKFGIKDFPPPAGGCLLTDPNFSKRMKYLISTARLNENEIELLKIGRHFCLDRGARLVVGRNKKENLKIEKLAMPGDFIIKTKEYPGPTGLFRGILSYEPLCQAASIVARYSDAPGNKEVEVSYQRVQDREEKTIKVKCAKEEEIENLRIEENV